MQFYYRNTEMDVMNTLYDQVDSCARMVVLTGRRRIGKTLLSLKFVENKPFIYLYVAKKSEALLCEEYVKQIQVAFPEVKIIGEIKRLKDVFELLFEIAKTEQYVLIIDEFQRFMNINPSIYSDLQQLWDLAKFEAKIQVLFLGSVYSMMCKIFEDEHEPLFGRADRILKLKPFPIHVTYKILQDYEHADLNTLFNYFLVTGGVPKYIDLMVTNNAFSEASIIDLICSSGSQFLNEGKHVLIGEFGKDYGMYFTILELLSLGKTGRGEIESILQKDIGGYLDRLANTYNIIKVLKPIDAKPNSKLQKYYITDLYLQFWFRFIYRNRTAVEMENFDFIKAVIKRNLRNYKGKILEQFFHQLFAESKQYNNIGSYWNRSGTDEIDLVAINDLEKKVVIAEIKLNKSKISLGALKHKAKNLIKKYHNYDIQYLALSLEDAVVYLGDSGTDSLSRG